MASNDINIQIYALDVESLSKFLEMRSKLQSFVSQFAPLFAVNVSLPKTVNSLSPETLYAHAAEFRGHLDTATAHLLAALVLQLQVKIATKLATKRYLEALTTAYKDNHPEITKARGYEEKELLARNYIDQDIVKQKEFWEDVHSDVVDLIGMIKVKMSAFKGGLDTILNQSGLLKIAAANKGLVLNEHQQKMLETLRNQSATEGETTL